MMLERSDDAAARAAASRTARVFGSLPARTTRFAGASASVTAITMCREMDMRFWLAHLVTVATAMALVGCATPGSFKAPVPEMAVPPAQQTPVPEMAAPPVQPPKTPPPQVETGTASWYGKAHNGLPTASGEIYDMNELTAAHRSLPLGTRVLVTNVKNGRSVEVRVNDRGPADHGRIIDLSYAAAVELGAVEDGTVPVRLRVLSSPPKEQKPAR